MTRDEVYEAFRRIVMDQPNADGFANAMRKDTTTWNFALVFYESAVPDADVVHHFIQLYPFQLLHLGRMCFEFVEEGTRKEPR